ncbi:MAG: hypothetical protein U0175_16585 [Caldilineaceae bacterium]
MNLRFARLLIFVMLALLPMACQAQPVPLSPNVVQHFYGGAYHRYWQEEYQAYTENRPSRNAPPNEQATVGERSDHWFLYPFRLDRSHLPALPVAVQAAHRFYFELVEAADWGNVYLYAVEIAGNHTYAVRVTTDGDDGWLEVFDAQGHLLGAARTYLELIAWDEQDTIRQQVATGEYPIALADRDKRTLWGK